MVLFSSIRFAINKKKTQSVNSASLKIQAIKLKLLVLNLKAGYLEGKVIGEDEVKKLAAMPSKEVLIAQVLYSFNFPIMK